MTLAVDEKDATGAYGIKGLSGRIKGKSGVFWARVHRDRSALCSEVLCDERKWRQEGERELESWRVQRRCKNPQHRGEDDKTNETWQTLRLASMIGGAVLFVYVISFVVILFIFVFRSFLSVHYISSTRLLVNLSVSFHLPVFLSHNFLLYCLSPCLGQWCSIHPSMRLVKQSIHSKHPEVSQYTDGYFKNKQINKLHSSFLGNKLKKWAGCGKCDTI